MKMVIAGKNILIVGVTDQSGALSELPVRVLVMDSRAEAIGCLRSEQIDTIVSHWDLIDCPDGQLLNDVIQAKPSTPTIAFIRANDTQQEMAARSLGVDAVLSEDIGGQYFRDTVCQLLGITSVASMCLTERDQSRTGQSEPVEVYHPPEVPRS